MSVRASFIDFMQQLPACTVPNKLLLGLSGGVDSVVMYQLLQSEGFLFSSAHANFGLRGAASDEDETFVRHLTQRDNIPLFCKKFETRAFAQSHKLSIQMAARNLRYHWFFQIMLRHQMTHLLLAHHADDILETSLLHLIKGTSLKGLVGIPINQNHIIRPLAFVSKREIEQWARQQQLSWREDASNANTQYQRNYIRHRLIPIGKSLNPNWEKTHVQTAKKIREAAEIFEHYKKQVKDRCFCITKAEVRVHIECLIKHGVNAYLLFSLLEPYGFTYSDAEQICTQWLTISQNTVGKIFYSKSHNCIKDRKYLFIIPKSQKTTVSKIITEATKKIILDDNVLIFQVQDNFTQIARDPNIAYLDADKLVFPLTLRYWRNGDFLIPLGMNGRKKVSDLLTDKKIPRHQKERTCVLCDEKAIIWVVGYQIHDDYKVTETTKRLLRIQKIDLR